MSVYEDGSCELPYHRGAVFTVELGSLAENGFDLGLDAYPIFDEDYRRGLNAKIIEHYWFREIGFETPQMFKRFLNRRMNEIMPFYNQLYESALLEFDPMANHRMDTSGESSGESRQTRDYERTENAEGSTSNKTESDARTLVSATPQMQLSGREDYATNITDSKSETKANGTTSTASAAKDSTTSGADSTERYVTRVSGLTGITGSQALQQFRDTFLNIDMMVVEDLNGLFMGIYTDYWNAL